MNLCVNKNSSFLFFFVRKQDSILSISRSMIKCHPLSNVSASLLLAPIGEEEQEKEEKSKYLLFEIALSMWEYSFGFVV